MLKKERGILLLSTLAIVLTNAGCQREIQREKVDAIAHNVVADVARVTQTSDGQKGAPILVIEETHASRGVRVEEAIVLNRLYYDHKVTQIGLEGSIKERPPVDAEWFSRAARNQSEAVIPVAVNLLREGEINSAEFMEMAYSNTVTPLPIETQNEYMVSEPEDNKALLVCATYLYQIALRAPRPEHSAKLAAFNAEIEELEGNEESQKAKLKEAQEFIYGLKPSELSGDPWVKETSDRLLNEDPSVMESIEEEISFHEKLRRDFESKGVTLHPDDVQIMESFVRFLRARQSANRTMVEAIAIAADNPDVYAVAMIIGAAHTKGIASLLKAADRPFAVIRPNSLSLKDDPTTLSAAMYRRKLEGSSIYSGEFSNSLLSAFPVNTNRLPPPVMQQKWFKAKAELYLYTERIAQKLLSGGSGRPPGGGGVPPGTFLPDDLNGDSVRIDPARIKVVEDVENSAVWTVVFAAELTAANRASRKTIWVKAGRSGEGIPPVQEKNLVEKMLKDALFEVKKTVKPKRGAANEPLPVLEDKAGRIKITLETTAAFADSEAAVMKKSVVVRS